MSYKSFELRIKNVAAFYDAILALSDPEFSVQTMAILKIERQRIEFIVWGNKAGDYRNYSRHLVLQINDQEVSNKYGIVSYNFNQSVGNSCINLDQLIAQLDNRVAEVSTELCMFNVAGFEDLCVSVKPLGVEVNFKLELLPANMDMARHPNTPALLVPVTPPQIVVRGRVRDVNCIFELLTRVLSLEYHREELWDNLDQALRSHAAKNSEYQQALMEMLPHITTQEWDNLCKLMAEIKYLEEKVYLYEREVHRAALDIEESKDRIRVLGAEKVPYVNSEEQADLADSILAPGIRFSAYDDEVYDYLLQIGRR